jgi:Alpha galactosidase A/Alpha galactosidase C-terminal beta sandwich domain
VRRSWSVAAAVLAAGAAIAVAAASVSQAPPIRTLHATGGPAPMGWSSWSFLRRHPTAADIEAQARALKASGLASLGYRYVNVDDYWMACNSDGPEVDRYGRWVPDQVAFPSGIAGLARYVHSLGLKFGLYVTPGIPASAVRQDTRIQGTASTAARIAETSVTEQNYNCGHMYGINYAAPGAQAYIDSWAAEFASWGVDYLKLDGVGTWDIPDIRAWSAALRRTGRAIILELSNSLAISHAALWPTLADGWRTEDDIECYACEKNGSSFPLTDWRHVASRFDAVAGWQPYGGPSGWNDEDSVEVGNGTHDGLTVAERRTVLSLWSLAGAPLILGTDLTHLTSADKAMLENRAVIAINQDGIAARRLIDSGNEQVFVKRQPGGTWYVGIFNTGTSGARTFHVQLAQLGIRHLVRAVDVWTGRSLKLMRGSYTTAVAPGGVSLIAMQAAA